MSRALLLLLCTGACLETGLSPFDSDSAMGRDSDDPGGGQHVTFGPEICNGIDDDGDGDVDEGFPDVDADGIADCRDEDCTVAELPALAVDEDVRCDGWSEEVEDPWDLAVEWQWREAGTVATPIVANLDDDDGDGDIDVDDVPDIVLSGYTTGEIIALSGASRTELWRTAGFRADGGVAVADIDGDARPEVIGIGIDNRVVALHEDGTVAWKSEDVYSLLYPIPTVTDLEGDGRVEVIADRAVVDGRTGTTRFVLETELTRPWRAPVAVDLDNDGRTEILLGNRAFSSTGKLLFELPLANRALAAFPAVIQADDDPYAEIAWAIGDELVYTDHNGSVLHRTPLDARGRPGPPCAGDLDGDGTPEIVVPANERLRAFGLDGRERWSAPIRDTSGSAGCVVFDMDGDAAFEVIYADMNDLMVLDGRSGTTLYLNGSHSSVTYFETPVVADIDGDESAEIIVGSSGVGSQLGITVFGHAGDGWPPAGPAWNVHDYYATNVSDGGSVQTDVEPGWRSHLVFRGRPATANAGLPDLAVSFVDACVASCEPGGLFRVAWQVRNEGARTVQPGAELAIDLVDGKNRTRIFTRTLPRIAPGQALPSEHADLPWTQVPQGGIEISVDPEGRIHECDEADNVDRLTRTGCEG